MVFPLITLLYLSWAFALLVEIKQASIFSLYALLLQHTKQEYMRVIYDEGIHLATMKGFFARAWGNLLLAIERS